MIRFIRFSLVLAAAGCMSTTRAQALLRNYDIPVTHSGSLLDNPWAGGMNSCQFSTIDLNDDGKDDLFVFDRVGNRISTYINESTVPGEIAYRYTREYQSAWPSELRNWVFLRDFNCDGKMDIVSNNQSGMRIWFNTSSGGNLAFTPANDGALIQAFYDIGSNPFNGPIYAISVDLPSFYDYDNDGDIDLFSFTETSVGMYFYKNMQVENGDCSQLSFTCANRCYGMFNESSESAALFIGEGFQCDFNVNNPRAGENSGEGPLRHTGGTILQLDLDQNGVTDMVLGDVTEPDLQAILMEESFAGLDSAAAVTTQFPLSYGGSLPANLNLFPGGFYIDVDNDGTSDLLLSPNTPIQAADRTSVWYYQNEGEEDLPSFQYVQDNFLQDGMIDLGIGAYPVVTDVNSDGFPDLVVANREYYSPDETFTSKLHYFRNNGTAEEPSFILEDDNWLDIPSLSLKSIYPAFGDIDNDGDLDLIIGDLDGFLRLFINSSGAGAPMNFDAAPVSVVDDSTLPIDIGQSATPQLIDYNQDGVIDLVVGERNGNVNYFKNNGTPEAYNFSLVEDTIGDIVATNFLGIFGFSVPHFFLNAEDQWELLLGTETGQINHFSDIVQNTGGTATLQTLDFLGIQEGHRCAVYMADINADDYSDLIVGQVGGGLGIYLSDENVVPAVGDRSKDRWRIFPNPADGVLHIRASDGVDASVIVHIYDAVGRIVFSAQPAGRELMIDTSAWPSGVYVIQAGEWRGRAVVR